VSQEPGVSALAGLQFQESFTGILQLLDSEFCLLSSISLELFLISLLSMAVCFSREAFS
jgi:hypothetical protein